MTDRRHVPVTREVFGGGRTAALDAVCIGVIAPASSGESVDGDVELYGRHSSRDWHVFQRRRSPSIEVLEAAASAPKASVLNPERRQAHHGGIVAHRGRW